MKKSIVLFFMILPMVIFSQIADDELQVNDPGIEFNNYSGPYRYKETFLQVLTIGKILSDNLNRSNDDNARFFNKYSVMHCIDSSSDATFDADILSIDPEARVENIRNVRTILASYISSQYKYTLKEAQTLSYFITIYNAVYRGNTEFFSKKYNKLVMQNINSTNAGLSVEYSEWAGNSKIIIPLTKGSKKPSTFELKNKDVSENIKSTDDKSVKERKDLVKLQEKEVADDKKQVEKKIAEIDIERKEVVKKEQEVATKKEEIEKTEKDIAFKESEIKSEKLAANNISDPEKKEKKLEELSRKEEETAQIKNKVKEEKTTVAEKEKQIEETKKVVADKEEKVKKEEKDLKEKEKLISEEKISLVKSETEIKAQKSPENTAKEVSKKAEEVAKKEQILEKKEEDLKTVEQNLKDGNTDPKVMGGKFYYLKVKEYFDNGHYSNEVHVIDPVSRSSILVSPYSNICGKNYLVSNQGIVVIGHKGDHKAQHYLILLDPNTLEVKAEGDVNIFFRSFVQKNKDFLYAVIKDGNDYYLAKFDMTMKMVSKSDNTVFNDTFVSFYDNNVYINSNNKEILILDVESLRLVDTVKP